MICLRSIVLLLVALTIPSVISEHRVYYVAIVEVDWDYAPSGTSLIHPNSSYSRIYLSSEPGYIGHTYNKVVFREFEDDTFTTMKIHSEYLGFLGPIIEAELGDTITVHLWNNATRNYSIHPQDLHYSKSSEGSFYGENHDSGRTSGAFVEPGSNFTYQWNVTSGPRDVDPDCVSSLYYSDVNMYKDVNSGLVGFILVCKKGTIGRNTRINNQFIFPAVIDENLSWYIENNMALRNVTQSRADDADFKESNRMHSINGFAFGNGPMFTFCIGDNITWHIGNMGDNRGVKTIRIHGHSFVLDGHRHDVIPIASGETITAQMLMTELGQWLIRTQSTDSIYNGLESILQINKCSGKRFTKPVYGKIRRHFIKIEEVVWDYAPEGNQFDSEDGSLTSEGSNSYLYFSKENGGIGGKYKKALYVEYTDSTFKKKKRGKVSEYGLMGPILGADVGDTLKVVLLNEASRPYSIHPQGVRFDKFNEGYSYNDSNDDPTYDFVKPGKQKTFYWTVPEYLGPMEKDEVCFLRYYTSAVDYVRDFHSGLVGPILICKKGTFDTQEEKRRFILMFSIMDENKSWYLQDNIKAFSNPSIYTISSTDLARSNQMHCINGYMYGNVHKLIVFPGREYKFHVMSLGSSTDIHTVYIHGRVLNVNGQTFTAYAIPPGTTATLNVNFHSDSDLGYKWALVDRVMPHLSAGVSALITVNPVEHRPAQGRLQEATYYIAAEEIFWDYNLGELPNGCNTSTCYKKAVFRQYDRDFMLKSNGNDEVGLFGPSILIEAGTKVEIVFKNKASRSYSFHAQGLQVSKDNEGANYGEEMGQIGVAPGQMFNYMLRIPETIGPSQNDAGCILYPFYSALDQERDLNSGLYGIFVVCKKDTMLFDTRADGVVKSTSFILGTIDESRSWYFTPGINSGPHIYNVINGYSPDVFPGSYSVGEEKYEFKFHSMGDRLHSLHFHGNTFDIFPLGSRQRDRITLYPGTSKTVQISNPQTGSWQIRGLTYDDVMSDVKIMCRFGKGLRAESGFKG
ncbi:hypothetical protein CHS0354_036446 [Potamilus streckersoni]|uniref:Plastocyanin-like domain-containing protein n=1 Tax=Potamilus streckersoni TaxID=2493646 RepID=A0AAE0SWM2_9BIVA|nr:hypothetical protein CHS0354_036446 [Potamilus streckersoni]